VLVTCVVVSVSVPVSLRVCVCVCVVLVGRLLWRRQLDVTGKEHRSVLSNHVTAERWWWRSTHVRQQTQRSALHRSLSAAVSWLKS